jgi:hypothetical protein
LADDAAEGAKYRRPRAEERGLTGGGSADALGLGHEALRLAQDEGDRAQHLGAAAQDAGEHRDLAGGRDGRPADGLAQRVEQELAGLVANVGRAWGANTVLGYLVAGDGSRRLVAFDRVAAAPHRRTTARLTFTAPAGSYKLVVGDLSRPIRVG